MGKREDLRNVAIIAHVDHGKTTLVDQLLRQSGIFRANEAVAERVMDSGDLERERGITILSKNTAVKYGGTKINIVDTPGHADFGGEVERVLMMVDGVLLLVDAFEGCMPQTRFVLKKALGLGKKPLVVLNKIDRPGARPAEVVDEVLDLFIELGASEDQLDFPVAYCSAREGCASLDPSVPGADMKPLFEMILNQVPAPEGDLDGPTQVLFSNIDYDEYVGRIGIGRVERGEIKVGQQVAICGGGEEGHRNAKISKLYQFEGLKRVEAESAKLGDIIAVSGITDLNIGETACTTDHIDPLPFVKIDEPTVSMLFKVNDSPFAGREGKFVTSRQIRERLQRETMKDVSLRVTEVENSTDSFNVAGRGEMSLSILMETMRREGYEFQVSPPRVLFREIDGVKCEPIERLVVDVPADCVGSVIEAIGRRKGDMLDMTPVGDRMKVQFLVPSRGLFGYRNEFLTATKGEGIMASVFEEYAPMKGDIARRSTGSLVAFETGEAVTYGLYNAQERGALFIGAGTPVYAGMIVGECPKQEDISVNVCKKKQLTNMRASGSDEALRLVPPRQMSLEQDLEFLADDELLEVTPENLRLRKRILDHGLRMREASKKKG